MRRSSRKGDGFIEMGANNETTGRHEEQQSRKFFEPRLVHILLLTGVFIGSEVLIAFQKWRREEAIICALPVVKERVLGN